MKNCSPSGAIFPGPDFAKAMIKANRTAEVSQDLDELEECSFQPKLVPRRNFIAVYMFYGL